MDDTLYTWIFFFAYFIAIIIIVAVNFKKGKSIKSFSVGSRQVSPFFIGLSLAANLTSVATFVINPGLIYAYGLAGFIGYAVAAPLGIFTGLFIMSKSFRKIGDQYNVITVPQWVGDRFKDKKITIYLAITSMLQITFLVLIIVAIAHVMMSLLQIDVVIALLIIICFTFTYIIIGGAGIHIWTNTVQAIIKIAFAILLIASGISLFSNGLGGFIEKLNAVGPDYGNITNPSSLLFRNYFEVIICNFLIGVAIITQPHVISKVLFLRSEKDVNKYLLTAFIVLFLFFAVLITGLYARLLLEGPVLQPDKVISTYILQMFSPIVRAFIMVGILSAGFSALEGIMIALSSIFSNDFMKNVFPSYANLSEEESRKKLLRASRIFLIVLAPVAFTLSYWQIVSPSLSVAIFAQNGVYSLISATFVPILFGIYSKTISKNTVFTASVSALVVYFTIYYGHITFMSNNPAFPGTMALIISTLIAVTGLVINKSKINKSAE